VTPSQVVSARQRHNILVRHHGADAPVTKDAARDLRAARLELAIREAVDAAPPLNDEQRSRLSAILRGNGAGDG